ncbi:hypothetical protein Q0812_04395 [Brevundimonas sp. 2R-24]|uniref:Uncharacterized protein n=1 Tax=Peiella sedimenti TaxID=3061083 RepID=A0ABT8SN07_9CAUL|nr:hypothetical protein [Caulobacteraceae bacterium XZ-24]
MRSVSPLKAGLAFAIVLGLWHFCWAVLVVIGWAQPFIDFIFRLHFIDPPYRIGAFDPATAALLIGITAAFGFIIGGALATAWNWLHRKDAA